MIQFKKAVRKTEFIGGFNNTIKSNNTPGPIYNINKSILSKKGCVFSR